MKAFKLFPALTIGALLAIVGEIVNAVQGVQTPGAGFDWWSALIAALPIVGGALVHYQVIPVAGVEQAVTAANTIEDILSQILSRLGPAKREALRRERRAQHGATVDPLP